MTSVGGTQTSDLSTRYTAERGQTHPCTFDRLGRLTFRTSVRWTVAITAHVGWGLAVWRRADKSKSGEDGGHGG